MVVMVVVLARNVFVWLQLLGCSRLLWLVKAVAKVALQINYREWSPLLNADGIFTDLLMFRKVV